GSEWWMLLTLAFIGAAQGMVISPKQTLTRQEAPPRAAGSSGGVLQAGQRLGPSMGLAIMTRPRFAVTAVSTSHMGMVSAFAAIAVVVALAGLVGLSEVRRGRSRRRCARIRPLISPSEGLSCQRNNVTDFRQSAVPEYGRL